MPKQPGEQNNRTYGKKRGFNFGIHTSPPQITRGGLWSRQVPSKGACRTFRRMTEGVPPPELEATAETHSIKLKRILE